MKGGKAIIVVHSDIFIFMMLTVHAAMGLRRLRPVKMVFKCQLHSELP